MTATRISLTIALFTAFFVAAPLALAQESPPPEQADEQPAATPSDQPSDDAEGRTPRQPSVEDVLEEFQKQRPKAEPLMPREADDEAAAPAGASGTGDGTRLRLPDGYFLVDRTGRLVRDGDWWVISFVSDNHPDKAPDPPMKLLPNQMLERMVRESQDGTQTVNFIVSGEVTDFMGENYLLLRKLMRRRDMGNLSS